MAQALYGKAEKEKDKERAGTDKAGIKYLGITEPITLAEPTPQDIKLNAALEKVLRDYNLFESVEECRKREEVLGKLNVIVKEWVRQVSVQKGLPEQIASETGAKIFTFGSYRLGVHVSGADIDTLCVGPRHIDRNDFFTGLYETLLKQKEVTELTTVPDAYVPVMNMKFSGISIDLLFARLALSIIPDDLDLLDENNLKNLDEKSILSLNGCRVADQILRLVPNIPNFRMTLRCLKFWAQRRGVYSNVLGYLGGVSWALLTARVCQLYPNALPSTLVSRFFRIYDQWKWPNPILLTQITDANLGHKVWNPKNPRDRLHLMPIITPAYPAMNSTYNVSESTLKLMKEEFSRGAELVLKIESNVSPWNLIFEKCDFFGRYKVYLQIDILAQTEQEHHKWEGLVESRLRFLIQKLEVTPFVQHAHPYPKVFGNPLTHAGFSHCSSFIMGLIFNLPKEKGANSAARSVDLTPAVGEFTCVVKEWQGRTNGMDVQVHYLRKNQLPSFIIEQFSTTPATSIGNDSAVPTSSPTPPLASSRKREMTGKSDGDKQAKKLKPDTPPPSKLQPAAQTLNGTVPPVSQASPVLSNSALAYSQLPTPSMPSNSSVTPDTPANGSLGHSKANGNSHLSPSSPVPVPASISPTTQPPTSQSPPLSQQLTSTETTITLDTPTLLSPTPTQLPSPTPPPTALQSSTPPTPLPTVPSPPPVVPLVSPSSPSTAPLNNELEHIAISDYELGELGVVGELVGTLPNITMTTTSSITRSTMRAANPTKKSLAVNLLRQ